MPVKPPDKQGAFFLKIAAMWESDRRMSIFLSVILILLLILLWVMIFDTHRFVVRREKISDKRIKKPFRAVIISDLHNKRYGKDNEKLIKAIKDEHPDMILVAGDIPHAIPGRSTDVAARLISALAADFPIYYGNGNHEYRMKIYEEDYHGAYEEYENAVKSYGVNLLSNETVDLEEYGISITGLEIDREYYRRFHSVKMGDEYMKETLGTSHDGKYNILIAHNPDFFPQYAKWGADLTISGHIHGGIIRVPAPRKREGAGTKIEMRGLLSPSISFFPKYDGGRFEESGRTLIVSRGLGDHSVCLRLFNPAEIVTVDFDIM